MNLHFFPAFFSGVFVAILSAIPVGPINFALVQTVLTRGKKAAMMIGIGGMIADAIFCFLAMMLFGWISGGHDNPEVFKWLNLLSIPVLIVLGVNMILKRNEGLEGKPVKTGGSGIFVGTMLGISNPVLFGYWLWIASVMQQEGWVRENFWDYFFFTLGVACGILGGFFGFIQLVGLGNKHVSDKFRRFFSMAVGIGFIVFGVFLAIRYAYLHL
jgi:threonine/homoserine/homoserine lactone efflux protein